MNKFLEVCSLLDWLMMEHGRILLDIVFLIVSMRCRSFMNNDFSLFQTYV
jgi:hypothetical protein